MVIINFEMKNKLFPINISNFTSKNLFNVEEEIEFDEDDIIQSMKEDQPEWLQAHVAYGHESKNQLKLGYDVDGNIKDVCISCARQHV